MNGRVYDPGLGRFLSPDPYVQMPDFSQNFNRYSYVLNNPLKYTDPSGEFFGTFFSALKDYITIAFTKGGFEFWNDGIKEWGKSENWHSTTNAWKIE